MHLSLKLDEKNCSLFLELNKEKNMFLKSPLLENLVSYVK